jgi:hypothetical protein
LTDKHGSNHRKHGLKTSLDKLGQKTETVILTGVTGQQMVNEIYNTVILSYKSNWGAEHPLIIKNLN